MVGGLILLPWPGAPGAGKILLTHLCPCAGAKTTRQAGGGGTLAG